MGQVSQNQLHTGQDVPVWDRCPRTSSTLGRMSTFGPAVPAVLPPAPPPCRAMGKSSILGQHHSAHPKPSACCPHHLHTEFQRKMRFIPVQMNFIPAQNQQSQSVPGVSVSAQGESPGGAGDLPQVQVADAELPSWSCHEALRSV